MVTQLPSTGKPTCDTSDMVMIHRFFRKLFADAPAMVRAVAPGDTAHAAPVADHLVEISEWLHTHHHGEDELLWDRLTARAPGCAAHVSEMKAAHAEVSAQLDQLAAAIPAWRATADAASAAEVAGILDSIDSTLTAHLSSEEKNILPVAAEVIPQLEWNELGEHGRSATPRNRQFVQLGYIFDSMDRQQRAEFAKAELPAPVRLLYRLIGKRQYDAERKALQGA